MKVIFHIEDQDTQEVIVGGIQKLSKAKEILLIQQEQNPHTRLCIGCKSGL